MKEGREKSLVAWEKLEEGGEIEGHARARLDLDCTKDGADK